MPLTAHNVGLTWTKLHAAILIAVVAVHIWLLGLFWTKDISRPLTRKETILILLPIESKATSSERKPKHTLAPPRHQHISSNDQHPAPEDRTLHLAAAELRHSEVANQIDWYAALDTAARQAAKTIATPSMLRELGPSISPQAPAAIEPPSVFTQPVHRSGAIAKTPDGDDIVWLSSNCYQVTNSSADHFKAFATGMPDTYKSTVVCKKSIGRSQGNAHMFDSLKHPSALEHPEHVGP